MDMSLILAVIYGPQVVVLGCWFFIAIKTLHSKLQPVALAARRNLRRPG